MFRKFTLLACLVACAIMGVAQNAVTVVVLTDCWPAESSYQILDEAGAVAFEVTAGTSLNANQTEFTETVDLPDGCFTFVMNDTYGDGLAGGSIASCGTDGNYTVTAADGSVLVQMDVAAFGNSASHEFSVGSNIPGCTDPAALNFSSCANIDDGSCTFAALAASFTPSSTTGCAGSSVTFTDSSEGGITGWSWTFEGGTPATSTEQNPTVSYAATGTFLATLEISDGSSTSTANETITISDGNQLQIVLVADNYPAETAWTLTDPDGNLVASQDGPISETVCIGEGCHTFNITDTYGDGICCGFGQGSYTLILNGTEIATGGAFGSGTSESINCPPGSDCNNPFDVGYGTHSTPAGGGWYTFTPVESGQFEITTCGLSTCDTKIWVYDYCDMSAFDDTNEATITYNDDICGTQAAVTPLLGQGQTYYIRIGDNAGDCAANPIDFTISFLGGIEGCLDINACNYDPIASEEGLCYYNDDPNCLNLGPDLDLLGDVLFSSMFLTTLNSTDQCLVDEGCTQGFGTRDIVRFTTHIKNIGNQDYFIGQESENSDQFEFDPCHGHFHYEGYAEYLLYQGDGTPMPQIGFKNGFCVLDLECSDGGQAKYTCGNMGITKQCGDIYSSGLACQWIDITDVPAGEYIFVARTNWDQSPDQNGRYELRYDNNWAQVCISFERDANGAVINFTKDDQCQIVLDCIGQPFGDAVPDCEGNCPGIVVKGDLNNSLELETTDSDLYVADILGGDAIVSNCTDINADGEISVTDASLIADCVLFGTDHVDVDGVHNHCIFDAEIVNPSHNVTLSIGDIDEANGTIDVHILNPDNRVLGFEFTISGATVQSVSSLYDAVDFDAAPQAQLGGDRILGLSYTNTSLPKLLSPTPFVRINYLALTGAEVCISGLEIVNEDVHNTTVTIGDCASVNGLEFANFNANTTDICETESVSYTDQSFGAFAWDWSFPGGSPASSTDQNPTISYMTPGVYTVTLTATNIDGTDSETKTSYITVNAGQVYYADTDNDGYGDSGSMVVSCDGQPAGYTTDNTDCDDTLDTVYPGAPGTGEDIDNNCDESVDGDEMSMSTICAGDMNNDGKIDTLDLLGVVGQLGCEGVCLGDMDQDADTDTTDLLFIIGVLGTDCP